MKETACAHYHALPGPSGFCFFFMRPREQTAVQFHPYCGCRERPDTECPTGGYPYKQFFPVGGKPRDPVTPVAPEATPDPGQVPATAGKRRKRRKKGKW